MPFLNKQAASCRNTLFNGDNRDQFAEVLDASWNGATPYTLWVAPGGQIIYRHTGTIEPLELKRAIVD
ncbi:hypothetical protein ACFL6U_13450 [Planctomycetota bacterium]